jgi:hypothetical protein
MIPNSDDRLRLIFDLVAGPEEIIATAIERVRRNRPGMRRADPADIITLLKIESDAVVARLRSGRKVS